jgi:superfamily II DNA or RNA helicase
MPQEFIPRDWQDRFVREYQTNTKKNFLLEGCVSAGKTGGAIYAYVSLKDGLDWRFFTSVVPSEHLRRQYAQDAARLFGLNLYYSGTSTRLGRLPTIKELLKDGYHGIVLSYQWLAANDNANALRRSIDGNVAGKIFLILDEVHHASSELAFGQACETAFPDHIVSHRLMTSGTPFRSDNNRILGNWVNYISVEENVYECLPDFRYTLADALSDEVIPAFSFVTMAGEFKYCRGRAEYDGKTFTNAQNEQELTDALNTAIYVDGDWVKTAIEWAHERMKRDRAKGFPECATYVRVPTIRAAHKMKERIRRLTKEDALVVVSRDDDPSSNSSFSENPSKLIEEFAAETGYSARSWIIGVGMLGEGISIKRLKYRIHATNIRASLSFMQDLGRLLRKFPDENPEPVETLIPAHPDLIKLAIKAMDEVAHVVREREEEESETSNSEGSSEGDGNTLTSSFQPLASTGELASQIVDGEEISPEYTSVAEWAVANKEIWRHWGKTPAHLAQMLQGESALFELLRQEYEANLNRTPSNLKDFSSEDVGNGFPSEYAIWLADEKTKFASKEAHKKAQHLAYVLYPDGKKGKIAEAIKEIHKVAKHRCGFRQNEHIGYQGWEKIHLWLLGRIAEAHKLKGTEDL